MFVDCRWHWRKSRVWSCRRRRLSGIRPAEPEPVAGHLQGGRLASPEGSHRRRLRAADEAAGQGAGVLAVAVGDLAGFDRDRIAVRALAQPATAGGQVVDHAWGMQAEPIQVDHVDVRASCRRDLTPARALANAVGQLDLIGGETGGFDLDAYLERIAFEGPREPTLGVLSALHRLHPAAIPFENLDPLLGRPVSLDLGALQAKLVGARRGGYCFEQNALFRAALTALGFAVTPLIARVVWMAPPGAPLGPRSHMLLRVDLPEGPYLADVGFGGHLFSAPLKLAPGLEQTTAESVLRLAAAGEALVLEARLPAGWASLYRFTLEPAEASDYETANWYTSTHPAHLFTNNLLAERLTPRVRSSLLNTRLTRRFPDGRTEVVELTSPGALARALEEDISLPPQEDIEGLFAKLPRG